MKLTELFAQADPAFGEAMNTLLESFHHSDDSQAPISATCSPTSSLIPHACSRPTYRGVSGAAGYSGTRRLAPHLATLHGPYDGATASLYRRAVAPAGDAQPESDEDGVLRLLSFLEREVLAKLHRLIYGRDDAFYGEQMHAKDAALGVMTSGGTIANVTALWLARNRACGDNLFALYEQGYRGAVILAPG